MSFSRRCCASADRPCSRFRRLLMRSSPCVSNQPMSSREICFRRRRTSRLSFALFSTSKNIIYSCLVFTLQNYTGGGEVRAKPEDFHANHNASSLALHFSGHPASTNVRSHYHFPCIQRSSNVRRKRCVKGHIPSSNRISSLKNKPPKS